MINEHSLHHQQCHTCFVIVISAKAACAIILYCLAGILGAHAVLFATSLCIVLKDLIEGKSVFKEWYTYFVSHLIISETHLLLQHYISCCVLA